MRTARVTESVTVTVPGSMFTAEVTVQLLEDPGQWSRSRWQATAWRARVWIDSPAVSSAASAHPVWQEQRATTPPLPRRC